MTKESKEGKGQKQQSGRTEKITIKESIKGSGDAGGFNRPRSGNAGDGTGSTGPRKKE